MSPQGDEGEDEYVRSLHFLMQLHSGGLGIHVIHLSLPRRRFLTHVLHLSPRLLLRTSLEDLADSRCESPNTFLTFGMFLVSTFTGVQTHGSPSKFWISNPGLPPPHLVTGRNSNWSSETHSCLFSLEKRCSTLKSSQPRLCRTVQQNLARRLLQLPDRILRLSQKDPDRSKPNSPPHLQVLSNIV